MIYVSINYSSVLEKQYEKADFVVPAENNSQPMNSLDIADSNKEGNIYCTAEFNVSMKKII